MFIPYIPWNTIMSYLHTEYDYEKQAVINEVKQKCIALGSRVEYYPALIPCFMLQTTCIWAPLQSKYRSYQQLESLDNEKCTCRYCKKELWTRY